MSMSTEYIIDRIDEATRFTRDYKQVCNDALCLARGRLASLQNSVEAKDKCIEELEAELGHLEQEVRDLKSELQNCSGPASEVTSCSVTDGEAVHDIDGVVSRSDRNKLYSVIAQCYETTSGSVADGCEDRWIPCSERLPCVFQDVFMKIRDTMFQERYIVPRFGYITGSNAWQIYGLPGNMINLPNGFEVIAWRPVPEDYKEFRVEEEEPIEEEVKFEIGDFVLCVSKAGVKINAVYLREDEEHYWILDKNCLTQQPLDKNRWKLTKYPGHMSVVEWLTYTPVS